MGDAGWGTCGGPLGANCIIEISYASVGNAKLLGIHSPWWLSIIDVCLVTVTTGCHGARYNMHAVIKSSQFASIYFPGFAFIMMHLLCCAFLNYLYFAFFKPWIFSQLFFHLYWSPFNITSVIVVHLYIFLFASPHYYGIHHYLWQGYPCEYTYYLH